jgi:hypothetical protein
MPFRSGNRVSAALALILFALLGQAHAAWVGGEGEMWLKWNMATRNAYVYAYVAGSLRGFTMGCNAGLDYLSSKRNYNPDEAEDVLSGCTKRSPVKLAKIDDRLLTGSITSFYRAYPKQRFLYISDILLKLLAGQSIDQIHREFPGSGDK